MRTIHYALIYLLLVASPLFAAAGPKGGGRGGGASNSIRAILVIASKEAGASDRRLAPYEGTLRRILRFESFRVVGEDSAVLAMPGEAALTLGAGHRLELTGEQSDAPGVRVRVRWLEAGHSLMNTGLVLQGRVPAVLGGPPVGGKGEVYAVLIIVN